LRRSVEYSPISPFPATFGILASSSVDFVRHSNICLRVSQPSFRRFQPDRENENDVGLVEPGSGGAHAITQQSTVSRITIARGIDDRSGVELAPCSRRHDFVTISYRAKNSFVCANAGRRRLTL
jgi:hypothetical protein